MTRLVADLQVLGSADAAAFSLERTQVDLGKLADETVREFAGLFEGAGVRLQTRLEPAMAWADPVRVGQILANLLSNALKYTPEGGLVRAEVTAGGPWAVIRVSDTGPGIPADELPHVFDRFFRGRTASAAGTGIGLTVVSPSSPAPMAGPPRRPASRGRAPPSPSGSPPRPILPRNRFLTDPSRPLPSVKASEQRRRSR